MKKYSKLPQDPEQEPDCKMQFSVQINKRLKNGTTKKEWKCKGKKKGRKIMKEAVMKYHKKDF